MTARHPAALLFLLLVATPLAAQQARVTSTTTVRYVDMLPLVLDSAGDFTSAPKQSATPVTQDFEISAWSLGIPGLRAYGLVRFRGALGSDLVWPRYGDHFDALLGFLELDRSSWRVRAGRLQQVSGLGIYTYDGGSAMWRPKPFARLEGFVGRGLARGFLEPLNSEEITSLDPLRPDQGTLYFGFAGSVTMRRGWRGSAIYQREILTDWSGLVSERGALDVQGPVSHAVTVTGSIDADFAAKAVGRARLAAAWRQRRGMVEIEAFRYRPVFDLTTIWGAFSPEGHQGLGARGEFIARPNLTLDGSISYRKYKPVTETTPFLVGVGDNSTALTLGGRWTRQAWSVDGHYQLLGGFGGAMSGGDVRLGWAPAEAKWSAGVRGVAFQQEQQFRVADGTVFGLGADGNLRLRESLSIHGDLAQYWHKPSEGDVLLNWSQTRGMLSVQWTFGANADRVGSYR